MFFLGGGELSHKIRILTVPPTLGFYKDYIFTLLLFKSTIKMRAKLETYVLYSVWSNTGKNKTGHTVWSQEPWIWVLLLLWPFLSCVAFDKNQQCVRLSFFLPNFSWRYKGDKPKESGFLKWKSFLTTDNLSGCTCDGGCLQMSMKDTFACMHMHTHTQTDLWILEVISFAKELRTFLFLFVIRKSFCKIKNSGYL